jgi:multiple sugar transport system ATP-binding protein
MTVRDNMAFSLKLRKADAELTNKRVGDAARILNLDPLLDRFPRELSGGQRQRVAMGRAIVRDPKVFLFDEPLSNLDARLRETMRGEIKRLHQSLGATSIYVTHDQIEAMTLADRIVAMNAGLVQQVGTPLDLYDRPANLFVAGFIGSPAMNMFGGTYRAADMSFIAQDNTAVPLERAYQCADGAAVTLGIRPEHVVVGGGKGIVAPVDLVEPTGFGTILHLRALGADLKAFTLERGTAKVGETTNVTLPPERLHLFDQNGTRLS